MITLCLSLPLFAAPAANVVPVPFFEPLNAPVQEELDAVLDEGLREAAVLECTSDEAVMGCRTLARSVLFGLQTLQNRQIPGLDDLDPLEQEDVLQRLADEIEFLMILGTHLADDAEFPDLWVKWYADAAVDPQYGALTSRLAWLRRDLDTLNPLLDWEYVGPFDNERGRGMTRPTDAEKDPAAEEYERQGLRPVGWRTLPDVRPRLGIVRFERLLHPIDQACVFARTWVHSDQDQRVHLNLGVAGEMRVWLNGVALAEALGEHSMAPDSFTVPLDLHAGWKRKSR